FSLNDPPTTQTYTLFPTRRSSDLANKSLKRFGEVITNPEVKGIVDILLKALSDPTKYTDESLDVLIKVHFVHYLDPPSLALVTRSEEHTSELQSRENLVCRLLLEK